MPKAEPMATQAQEIARAFHETYERRAPAYGYKTREESAVPWEELHPRNKSLMVSTVHDLLERGVIAHGSEVRPAP